MDSVFVLNCGSSSIKFQLIEVESANVLLKGIAENLNTQRATLKWSEGEKPLGLCNPKHALDAIIEIIQDQKISAIGHRVVHGGELFSASALIDDSVLDNIRNLSPLAPLHNPLNVMGIEEMQKRFPTLPQIAVFDTAFHQTLEPYAFLYALPYEYYKEHKIRRYGFHGTSHRFVVQEGAKKIGKALEETSFISCHLGNGCSVTATKGGKSIDTSMGLTPLEGLMMGQRSGDLDPSVVETLCKTLSISPQEMVSILNKKSGLLGVSGESEDMRLLLASDNERCRLAIEMFCYRVAKYIAAYVVPLQTVDRVIFTGGIGENAAPIREMIMEQIKPLKLESLVIPTNEELMIAQDTLRLALEAR